MKLYVATMYRFGNNNKHSYVLGVYDDINLATKEIDKEEERRAGKYEGEILVTYLNLTLHS